MELGASLKDMNFFSKWYIVSVLLLHCDCN